jgi:hypothetical protein
MPGVIQPVERRAEVALQLRISLLELLAPEGRCACCGKVFAIEQLTVGHVDGCTYDRYALAAWSRAARYWAEYDAGVRLQAECGSCNSRDGATRWQGRPRYVRGADRRAA